MSGKRKVIIRTKDGETESAAIKRVMQNFINRGEQLQKYEFVIESYPGVPESQRPKAGKR